MTAISGVEFLILVREFVRGVRDGSLRRFVCFDRNIDGS